MKVFLLFIGICLSTGSAIAEDSTPDCVPYGYDLVPVSEMQGLANCQSISSTEFMCEKVGLGEKPVVVINSTTGKTTKNFKIPLEDIGRTIYTPQGPVEVASSSTEVRLRNLVTEVETTLPFPESLSGQGYTFGGSMVIHGKQNLFGFGCLKRKGCGTLRFEVSDNEIKNLQFSKSTVKQSGVYLIVSSSFLPPDLRPKPKAAFAIVDSLTGSAVAGIPRDYDIHIDHAGKKLFYSDYENLILKDLVTGKEQRISRAQIGCSAPDLIHVQKDSGLLYQCGSKCHFVDFTNAAPVVIEGSECPSRYQGEIFGDYLHATSLWAFSKIALKQVCFNRGEYQVASGAESGGCDLQGGAFATKEQAEIADKLLCSNSFDKESWEATHPMPQPGKISPASALRVLWRFNKPGGFDANVHLPILDAILGSEVAKNHPDLVLSVLSNAALKYPREMSFLTTRRKARINQLEKRVGAPSSDCLTEEERKDVQNQLVSRVKEISDLEQKYFNEKIRLLQPHAGALKRLPEAIKEELITHLARSNAQVASESGGMGGVFQSKLVLFSKKAFSPLFGRSPPPATDAVLVESRGRLIPLIVGTQPIDGARNTGWWSRLVARWYGQSSAVDDEGLHFGFRVATLGAVGKSDGSIDIEWNHGGKKYSSRFDVRETTESETWTPKEAAPRYKELWADGVLSGVVVAGVNLGDSFGEEMIEQFIGYYTDRDFEFAENEEDLPNARAYLERKVVSGEVDYFVKQAHSDGDDRNLFKVPAQGKKLTGIKRLPNGKQERIELIYPATGDDGKLLSNQEFGRWIRDRKGGQLVYLNGSCWSYRKAVEEIKATKSDKLLNIPVVGSVVFFRDQPEESGEYRFFDAFFAEKSFNGIREEMQKSKEYKEGKTRYIFPDDSEYVTRVITPLKSVEIKTSVLNEKNESYNFDASH